MTRREYQLLKELRRLSPEAQAEVFEYAKWLRGVEAKERLRGEAWSNYEKVMQEIF